MNFSEIVKTCEYHHSSWTPGYVRVKESPRITPYSGRFGNGYTVDFHTDKSTQFARREYWILKDRTAL